MVYVAKLQKSNDKPNLEIKSKKPPEWEVLNYSALSDVSSVASVLFSSTCS